MNIPCKFLISTKIRITILAMLFVSLAGCLPESENPLTPANKETIDAKVLGSWYWKDKNESGYIHIGLDEKTGLLRIIMAEYDRNDNLKSTEYSGHTSFLKGNTYFNLKEIRSTADSSPGYFFVKYTTRSDSLGFAIINSTTVQRAIENGLLKGEIKTKRKWVSSILITEDQKNLQKYVIENDKELFPKTVYLSKVVLKSTPKG